MDVTKSLFPSSVELLRCILVSIIHLRDRRPSKHELHCTSLHKINHYILLSEKSSNPFLPVDRWPLLVIKEVLSLLCAFQNGPEVLSDTTAHGRLLKCCHGVEVAATCMQVEVNEPLVWCHPTHSLWEESGYSPVTEVSNPSWAMAVDLLTVRSSIQSS